MNVEICNGKKSKTRHEQRTRMKKESKERRRTGCVTHQLMQEFEQMRGCENTQPSTLKPLGIASFDSAFPHPLQPRRSNGRHGQHITRTE